MHSNSQIIVALDVDTCNDAWQLVERLGPTAMHYKVGLQLLTAVGPQVVTALVGAGKSVFLDLKLFEIPNSVAAAVHAAGKLGVSMVTVHGSAGSAVLKAAVSAAHCYPDLKILALTVITSMRDKDLNEVGVAGLVLNQVTRLATLAAQAGCHGVVASPQEAPILRALLPAPMLIVTPGIQLEGAQPDDQARFATPAAALQAGATHIVMGRSITQAPDPLAAYELACAQVGKESGGWGALRSGLNVTLWKE